MGKRFAQVLAFVHFTVTEMRPIWLLWYTVYSTFETILTTIALFDAYESHDVAECLLEERITGQELHDCADTTYKRYLAHGAAEKSETECSEGCPGATLFVGSPEPRSLFFFMTVWLFGFLLLLLLYFIYRRPNYHTGSYINFTQSLYASKAYKIVGMFTFVVSVVVILIGIYILIKEGKDWSQYTVALLLMLLASKSLLLEKSNGLNINSKEFWGLEICRGNALMSIWNFFLTTNTVLLDEMEVQLMKNGLPKNVAADNSSEKGCCAAFAWYPLREKGINILLANNDKINAQGTDNTNC